MREQCIEKWQRENPRKSISEGLKVTAKSAINMFKDELHFAVQKLAAIKSNDMKMIYLDKNYPPSEIKQTVQTVLKTLESPETTIRLMALVPDVPKNSQCSNDMPFSTTFLT